MRRTKTSKYIKTEHEVKYFESLESSLSPRQLRRMNKHQARTLRGETQIAEETIDRYKREQFKLEPKTQGQAELIYGMDHYNQVVVFGPAGTGKTYVISAYAAQLFLQKKIDKIIITRPNVPTGRTLGLFPGDINQKMAVWLQPVIAVLKQVLGTAVFDIAHSRGDIVFQPLETIRGCSFDNAFIIIDESQNINIDEVKALVTRVGDNTTIVFNGDIAQKDINTNSGLQFIIDKIQSNEKLNEVSYIVELDLSDVVRSKLCKLWVEAFNV